MPSLEAIYESLGTFGTVWEGGRLLLRALAGKSDKSTNTGKGDNGRPGVSEVLWLCSQLSGRRGGCGRPRKAAVVVVGALQIKISLAAVENGPRKVCRPIGGASLGPSALQANNGTITRESSTLHGH